MKIAKSSLELIGNTPLVSINKIHSSKEAKIIAKLESFNPLGCVKERIALSMIESAEKEGKLSPGGLIIEPTSGNTGIGLAFVSAVKGYKLILTMPDSMSIERRKLLKALGAEIILTPAAEGMKGAIKKAQELKKDNKGSYIPQQFENPANPQVHYKTTAQEIWNDTAGKIDVFVAGVGTGGTITGIGKYLKEQNSSIKIVAVEPAGSAVLSGQKAGTHRIQGIGAGFVPDILDQKIIDEILLVQDEAAIKTTRELAKKEGILCGISSGAAMNGALQIADRRESGIKNIVVLLPDTGERYLSTDLFED